MSQLRAFVLLGVGAGAAGLGVGILLPGGGEGSSLLHLAVAPAAAPDPGIPLPWSPAGLLPDEIQGAGMDRAASALGLLALSLLAVGAGSAALLLAFGGAAERRERALRGLVGAPPIRLLLRSFMEGVGLALAGGATALALAVLGARGLLRRWPGEVASAAPVLLPVAATIGIGAGIVLLGVVAPALRVFRAGWLTDGLAPQARTNPGVGFETVRTLAMAGQGMLAVTLVYVAGVLVLAEVPGEGAGTAGHGDVLFSDLVVVELDGSDLPEPLRLERHLALADQVRALPGVVATGLASRGALGGRGPLDWVVMPLAGGLLGTHAEHHAVTPEWFDTLGVSLVGSPPRPGGVTVNATFARFAAWRGPEEGDGAVRYIGLNGPRGGLTQPVGLLQDNLPLAAAGWGRLYRLFPFANVTSRAPPVIYLAFEEVPPARAELLVRLAPGPRSPKPRGSLEELVAAGLAGAPSGAGLRIGRVERVPERLERMASTGRWLSVAVILLGTLGLVLAVIGVEGVFRVAVRQRVGELGLRRALGGGRARVVRALLGELLIPLAIAAWLGIGTSVAAGQALSALLPDAPLFHLRLYLAAVSLVVAAGVLGALGPALHATSLPPAQAIRRGEEVPGGGLTG